MIALGELLFLCVGAKKDTSVWDLVQEMFQCLFLRRRVSMHMRCLDGLGRESWVTVLLPSSFGYVAYGLSQSDPKS